MVEESVTAVPTAAVVGVTKPAVRSGRLETVTEFEQETVPVDCPFEVTITAAVLVPVVLYDLLTLMVVPESELVPLHE
jgi:hypothetical protein